MTFKAGEKYLRTGVNLLLIFFIAFIFSQSKYIPSGAHPNTLKEIIDFFIKDSKSEYYKFSKEYNPKTKNYKSGLYQLILNSIDNTDIKRKIIILIVAESLGIVEDKDLELRIEKLFQDKFQSVINDTQDNKFELLRLKNENSPGGTLRMEYMSLCNNFKQYEEELFDKCLPNLLKNKNSWESIYMHSPSLEFYNRSKIMREIGFQELFSQREILIKQRNIIKQIKLCFSRNFCAPSDEELFKSALKKIKEIKNTNLFLNILTVEGHGPFRGKNISKERNELENYYKKAEISISQISNFLKLLLRENKNKELEIYIVSDHPPVLTSLKNKGTLNYSFLIKRKN